MSPLVPAALIVISGLLAWATAPRCDHDWGIADMHYYDEDEPSLEQCVKCGRRRRR